MSESPIQNVGDTAFMTAGYRALESARPDALFRDPLAARLAGDKGMAIAKNMQRPFVGGWTLVVRTVVIDDMLEEAIGRCVDTVLNLGAGLDARPYRMDLPATLRWIEADRDSIVEWKEKRLAGETPRCRLERKKVDLTDREARTELLSDACAGAKNVLVLTEGVVPYLSLEEAAALADDLGARKEIRGWIVDYFAPEVQRYREKSGMAGRMRNAPFRFYPPDWRAFFRDHGWALEEMRYLPSEGQRLGRPFPAPPHLKLLMKLFLRFASPRRRAAMMQFAGYALLKPAPPRAT